VIYPHPEVDGSATALTLFTTHTYDPPDTLVTTARVHSHRDSNPNATWRRIPNRPKPAS
jgi:hypothetical protein